MLYLELHPAPFLRCAVIGNRGTVHVKQSLDSPSTCTYVHFSTHTCSFPRSVGDNEAVRVAAEITIENS